MPKHLEQKGLLLSDASQDIQMLIADVDNRRASYESSQTTRNNLVDLCNLHYLGGEVLGSTEEVDGNNYIHNAVKPVVDTVTTFTIKGLLPNGALEFDFKPKYVGDTDAAEQAQLIVSYIMGEEVDVRRLLRDAVQDAALHKNSLIRNHWSEVDEKRYIKVSDLDDNGIKTYIHKCESTGVKCRMLKKSKIRHEMETVPALTKSGKQKFDTLQEASLGIYGEELTDAKGKVVMNTTKTPMTEEVEHNFYDVKFEIIKTDVKSSYEIIDPKRYVTDSTVDHLQDTPFLSFWDYLPISEVKTRYPWTSWEKLTEVTTGTATDLSGSDDMDQSIHLNDDDLSTEFLDSAVDEAGKKIQIWTSYIRTPFHNKDSIDLIEVIHADGYIISLKEVEYIPLAEFSLDPLVNNFYGQSIGEYQIQVGEYVTAQVRNMYNYGQRAGVSQLAVHEGKEIEVDAIEEQYSGIVFASDEFNFATDWASVPKDLGDMMPVQGSIDNIKENGSSISGVIGLNDPINIELAKPGNSDIKLQSSQTPHNLQVEDKIRNASSGVKDLIYITWRGALAHGDTMYVKNIVELVTPDRMKRQDPNTEQKVATFFDFDNFQNFNWYDRCNMSLTLAIGNRSEENMLSNAEYIASLQKEFEHTLEVLMKAGLFEQDTYDQAKITFIERFEALGRKDVDQVLPSFDQATKVFEKLTEKMENKPQPDPKTDPVLAKSHKDFYQGEKAKVEAELEPFEKQLESRDGKNY